MEKYMFLDFDGVIATERATDESGMWGLDSACQILLKLIIAKTKAKIVITSSWRKHTLEETINYLKEKGFMCCEDIVGITIRAYNYLGKEKIHLSIPRGVEIKQWLDTHVIYPWYAYPERNEEFKVYNNDGSFKMMRSQKFTVDYNYLILDDDCDMLLEHKNNFIQTHSTNGISLEDAIKSIKILNNTKNKVLSEEEKKQVIKELEWFRL